jgi:hypothetical protein
MTMVLGLVICTDRSPYGVTTNKDCCVTDQRNVLGTFLSFLFRTGVRPSSNTPTHLAARVEVLDASLF